MSSLLHNRWSRLGAGAVLMAVLGFIATFAAIGGLRSNDTVATIERVAFAYSTSPEDPRTCQ